MLKKRFINYLIQNGDAPPEWLDLKPHKNIQRFWLDRDIKRSEKFRVSSTHEWDGRHYSGPFKRNAKDN